MIEIAAVDHIGVRVHDLDRAMKFYGMLGFRLEHKATNDAVAVPASPSRATMPAAVQVGAAPAAASTAPLRFRR